MTDQVGLPVATLIAAVGGLFGLLYRSLHDRCTRAERQVDTILPALEKLTDLMERQGRAG